MPLARAVLHLGSAALLLASCAAASAAQSGPADGCAGDSQNIASMPFVREAKRVLGIGAADITFRCGTRGFETSRSSNLTYYTIYYPALPDPRRYKAPITHELAHVVQLQHTGASRELLAEFQGSSARVELGADFLAGVVYQKAWNKDADSFSYQSDSVLLGSFAFNDPRHHGTQIDRNNAFRLGRYIRDEKARGDVWVDHRYFQQFLFSQFERGQ